MTIHSRLAVAVCGSWTFWGSSAPALEADDTAPAPGPATQPTIAPATGAAPTAPPAHRGFQLALRTGYSVPFGDVTKNKPMSDSFGGQVPFTLDVGGKLGDYVFLGGFLGTSVGGVGKPLAETCEACSTVGAWFGAEVLVSLLPAGKVDPWLGYGVGMEYNSVHVEGAVVEFAGYVPLMLTGGVDFRMSRIFGLGPFGGLAVARYSKAGADDGDDTYTIELEKITATHGWVTFGVRGVLFP